MSVPDPLFNPGHAPRRCRHPKVSRVFTVTDPTTQPISGYSSCGSCGQPIDIAASARGRRNRQRGNAIERWVCKLLGISRVGQYGGLEDGRGDHLVVQVKSGGAHQAGLLAKIHTIPVNADQLRGWVTVSTPGAGHPREGVISFDLREFAAWYGKGSGEEAA